MMRDFVQRHLLLYRLSVAGLVMASLIVGRQHEWFGVLIVIVALSMVLGRLFDSVLSETLRSAAFDSRWPCNTFYLGRWVWRGCPKLDRIEDIIR